MKIDVNSILPANQYKITSKNVAAIQPTSIIHQDTIEISSDAKLFSEALRTAKSAILDRLDRPEADLAAIKNKIANDEYHVNSNTLAKDLLMDK